MYQLNLGLQPYNFFYIISIVLPWALSICVYTQMCVAWYIIERYNRKDNLWTPFPSFHLVGPTDRAQVTRLGCKCLYSQVISSWRLKVTVLQQKFFFHLLLATFLISMTKIPGQNHLRKAYFIWSHNLRVQSMRSGSHRNRNLRHLTTWVYSQEAED